MTELIYVPPAPPQPGILGVEGIHTWNDTVTLNDRSVQPPDGPRAFIETIPGLHSLADPEDLRDLATGRSGEIARNSVRRGKTVTYNGLIQSPSLNELRALWTQIAGAFVPMAEGRMLVTPDPGYEPGVTRHFRARCLTCDDGDLDLDADRVWPYQMPFAIALRLADARFYDPVSVEGDAVPAGSGPTGAITLNNEGTAPADPLVRLYGPFEATQVTVQKGTLQLFFDDISGITSGHYLDVDFASRRIRTDAGVDYSGHLEPVGSDWWDADEEGISPGDNDIEVIHSTAGAPSWYAHISFNPAYVA